jgi:hypothetical protein
MPDDRLGPRVVRQAMQPGDGQLLNGRVIGGSVHPHGDCTEQAGLPAFSGECGIEEPPRRAGRVVLTQSGSDRHSHRSASGRRKAGLRLRLRSPWSPRAWHVPAAAGIKTKAGRRATGPCRPAGPARDRAANANQHQLVMLGSRLLGGTSRREELSHVAMALCPRRSMIWGVLPPVSSGAPDRC